MSLLERGLFSLLHCGEDTAVCLTKRESLETEALALVESDESEEVIHNIHIDRHKYPPSAAISSRISHTPAPLSTICNNFQTLLAAFFHRIYKLTNLATVLDNPYGSVRRSGQCCPASAQCCLSLRLFCGVS